MTLNRWGIVIDMALKLSDLIPTALRLRARVKSQIQSLVNKLISLVVPKANYRRLRGYDFMSVILKQTSI